MSNPELGGFSLSKSLIRRAAISASRRLRRGVYRVRARLGLTPDRLPLDVEDYDRIRSICAFLGPYRNLTTLSASILSLHPNCQVLNHGGFRILTENQLNIFRSSDEATFRRFCRYAIDESQGGTGGDDGGSIIHSHSFRDQRVKSTYLARFPEGKPVGQIQSLAWKESLAVSNYLRQKDINIAALFQANQKLRFLMPIRHPIDCAASNLKTGHAKRFPSRPRDLEGAIEAVVAEIVDFRRAQQDYPDRFFSFTQHEIDTSLLERLATFLGIPMDPQWEQDVFAACEIRKPYQHGEVEVSRYRALVERSFTDDEEMMQRLLRYVES